MRKKIVAGNWKMNKTPSEAIKLVIELKPLVENKDVDVIFCVPSISILSTAELVKGSDIAVGAQNMFYEDRGAYTGEISAEMLVDADVKYVIVGHSERRQYFHETNEIVNKKMRKVLEYNMIPIVCCGETLQQREQGITIAFIKEQITEAYKDISPEDAVKTIVAYEPIWAIGTGRVATCEQAEKVCEAIRRCISEIYNKEIADQIRILYGGSVNAGNAAELFASDNIDGGLIGGASLKTEFADIVNYKRV